MSSETKKATQKIDFFYTEKEKKIMKAFEDWLLSLSISTTRSKSYSELIYKSDIMNVKKLGEKMNSLNQSGDIHASRRWLVSTVGIEDEDVDDIMNNLVKQGYYIRKNTITISSPKFQLPSNENASSESNKLLQTSFILLFIFHS